MIHHELGNEQLAQQDFEKAIAIDPKIADGNESSSADDEEE